MDNIKVEQKTSEWSRSRRRKKVWQRVLAGMMSVVVFTTTYAMILPAITEEQKVFCGHEEHRHDETCFERVLICGQPAEEEGAVVLLGGGHAAQALEGDAAPTDDAAPTETPTDADASNEGILTSPAAPQDDSNSLASPAGEDVETPTEPDAQDAQRAAEGVGPYDGNGEDASDEVTPAPAQEPAPAHVHTPACYELRLICDKAEHEHSLVCFADVNADLETEEVWAASVAGVELTGVWADDVVAIAKSQLGQGESEKNYMVDAAGAKQGYTRFGAWWGAANAYDPWCAMFVSFVLNYAAVPETAMPRDAGCAHWQGVLQEQGLWRAAADYTPKAGDIVFFDHMVDGYRDGQADHVGLVSGLELDENGNITKVNTIEGNNSNKVESFTYAPDDGRILGYGVLPENPEAPARALPEEEAAAAEPVSLLADPVDGVVVTMTADPASLPYPIEELSLSVAPVADEAAEALIDNETETREGAVRKTMLFDIKILHGEEEVQPLGPVSVSFAGIETPNKDAQVFHVDTAAEAVEEVTAEAAAEGEVAMETEHFSIYGVTYTVDFHWGDYTFSIAGETDIRLSALFAELGIERDAAQAVNVVFSDPELVRVDRLEEENDWLLVSLAPFQTEEKLSITFSDGTVLEIRVTDDGYSDWIGWIHGHYKITKITDEGIGLAGARFRVTIYSDLPDGSRYTYYDEYVTTDSSGVARDVTGGLDRTHGSYNGSPWKWRVVEVSAPSGYVGNASRSGTGALPMEIGPFKNYPGQSSGNPYSEREFSDVCAKVVNTYSGAEIRKPDDELQFHTWSMYVDRDLYSSWNAGAKVYVLHYAKSMSHYTSTYNVYDQNAVPEGFRAHPGFQLNAHRYQPPVDAWITGFISERYYLYEKKHDGSNYMPPERFGWDDNNSGINVGTARVNNRDMPLFTLHQDPILGTLRFRKVNASGQPITNAVFRLTGTSSIHGQIHDLSNTNQKYLTSVHTGNGWYEIRDVPYGRAGDTYTVTETTVPAGYKAVTFTVAGSNFQEHGLTYEYTEVNGNVVDPVATGTVTLTKVNASGARVNGAVFTISGTGLDGKAFSIDSNTGSNGVYTFSKVPVGTTANYTIKEKTPPTGYNLPQNNSFTFRGNLVTKDGTYAYPTNITDPVATGELRFAKQNAAGRRLNGAVFTITGTSSYSGKAFTLTSTPIHSNGAYRIPDIPVGKSTDVYTVTETTTPPGYKPVTFTIKGNQIPAGSALTLPDPVTDPVATGTVWFRKYTESGDAMRGGDFKIEGTGLDGVPFSIDAIYWYGGRYRAFNVPAGAAGSIYTLTETGAPAGFKNVSFTIPGDAVAAAIAANVRYDYPDPVVDPTNTGTLRFTKVNEGNGPLTGAQFVMTGHSSYRGDFGPLSSVDLYQESVDAGSPDETLRGVYEIRNVPYGLVGDEYDVEETVVPAGYEAVSFKVTGDHFQTDGATYTLPDPVVDPLEQLKYTLTVTNTVENGKGDPRFPFEITITDPNAGEAYKPDPSTVHVYDTNGEVPNGATVDPSTGLVSVPELGDVWRVEIENVPAGDSVVVRETSHPGYDVHIGGAGTADPNDPDATQPITMNGNKTVAFTNRRNTGDLTLTNTVIGGPADKTFPFEITITDPNGDPYTPDPSKIHDQNGNAVPGVTVDNGKVSVPALGDGDVIVIEDIPKGSTVQITEKEHASYTVSIGGDGSPSAGDPATSEPITIDGDKTVAFTNEYTVYPFTVTNTIVNGPNGKTFPFEIVITKPDGTTRYISPGDKVKVFNGTTEVPNGAEVDPGTGLITVPALGNGWKVVVEDVPAESTAVVTQTDYTGYSVSIGGDGTAATGTPNVSNPVSIDGPKTVDFTSSRALMSVTVTKTVTGGGVDTRFPISVEVTMQDPLALSARVYDANDDEDTTRTVRITGGSVGVELANGERIVIENIPKGSTLAVTETQHDGYTVLINNLTDGGTTSGDSVSGVNINQPTTIEVVNNPGYELPHTGGAGTSLYALGGTALTGLALVYGLTRRRRKGEA